LNLPNQGRGKLFVSKLIDEFHTHPCPFCPVSAHCCPRYPELIATSVDFIGIFDWHVRLSKSGSPQSRTCLPAGRKNAKGDFFSFSLSQREAKRYSLQIHLVVSNYNTIPLVVLLDGKRKFSFLCALRAFAVGIQSVQQYCYIPTVRRTVALP